MNFIKAAAIAISAVIACGAAEAKMPKEVNIVYVKAPFNLQNMVIKDQKLLEKAFAKDGVKVNWKTITSGRPAEPGDGGRLSRRFSRDEHRLAPSRERRGEPGPDRDWGRPSFRKLRDRREVRLD